MKYFIRNLKNYGVFYAIGMMLWIKLDDMSDHKKVVLQEKIEQILNKYDKHLMPQNETTLEEQIATPCGCVIYNDCQECAIYPACTCWMDTDFERGINHE